MQPIAAIEIQMGQCFIMLLKKLVADCKITHSYEENIKKINFISAYCIIWAVGSGIETESYAKF